MSPEEAFKLGFLSRCVEERLPSDRIAVLAKQASSAFEKEAVAPTAAAGVGSFLGLDKLSLPGMIGSALNLPRAGLGTVRDATGALKDLSPLFLLAAAAPPTVGGIAAALQNVGTDISEADVEEAKQQELSDTYRRMSDQLKRQQAARSFKQDSKKSGRIFM